MARRNRRQGGSQTSAWAAMSLSHLQLSARSVALGGLSLIALHIHQRPCFSTAPEILQSSPSALKGGRTQEGAQPTTRKRGRR